MSFRLLRVKRRADQDPASSLYLPVEDDNKRSRTETDEKEFRLFKIIERGNREPTKIINPTQRQAESTNETKVILLSDSKDISTVAEAILIENGAFKHKKDLSKLIKSEISDRFESFNIQDVEMNGEFVYDVYRLDLGRFTSKDIEGKSNCIQIVPYEQEFLTDEEGSESEVFEDDSDSNAEDYYANDYPEEEESQLSDNYEDEFLDGELSDEFFFDQSVEIEEFDDEDGFDLDPEDYEEKSDSFTDDFDEDGIYSYDEDEYNKNH